MKLASLLLAALIPACAMGETTTPTGPGTDPGQVDDNPSAGQPLGHKTITPTIQNATPAAGANDILYHGGSVMTSTHNAVYLIWYGTWNANAQAIITDWAHHIGGSSYFDINTTYHNKAGTFITNAVKFGGAITDNYSLGKTLDDAGVQSVVSNAISAGKLPLSSNGIYFVLGAADVMESSGMCSQYCGWHYFGNISGKNIKYSYVGNPDQCPTSCAAQTSGPNGDAGADGAVSIMSHELEETVTDPYVSAWYDASGQENGDKCAWTFGTEQAASNGAMFNVTIGTRNYLIQQNWNAATQSCGLQL
jgi:hypothetical protein